MRVAVVIRGRCFHQTSSNHSFEWLLTVPSDYWVAGSGGLILKDGLNQISKAERSHIPYFMLTYLPLKLKLCHSSWL